MRRRFWPVGKGEKEGRFEGEESGCLVRGRGKPGSGEGRLERKGKWTV